MVKLINELKDEMKKEFKILERDLRSELREISKELKDINEGMNFINQDIEDIKQKLDAVVSENTALKKKNVELTAKFDAMALSLKENELRLVQCEQYSRRHNIEIKGIPKVEAENVTELVIKLGDVIGEPIAITDLEACHRVPTKEMSKTNVIVQFQRRQKRDSVLNKAKQKRIICQDLGLTEESPVYVNEHLCPSMKRLLGMAVSRKRQFQWRYVWVRNCKILARKADGAPVVQICHEGDLPFLLSL